MRLLLMISLLFLTACKDEERIVKYIEPDSPSLNNTVEPPVIPLIDDKVLTWTLPVGWKDLNQSSAMRVATLQTSNGLECTVIKLHGEAGGEKANIERWAGQIQAKPVEFMAFESKSGIKYKAGWFKGEAGSVIAAIIFDGQNTWFFKIMNKDHDAVEGLSREFNDLLGSIKWN